MTGWIIFFGVIIFILLVLMIPVHVKAFYKDDFSLKIKFLLFFNLTVFPMKEKKKEEKKSEETKKETEKKPQAQKEKRKMTLEEIIDTVIDYTERYGPGAKMILHNIRFHKVTLYWKVGAEDAAACGIKFGRVCGWISGVLGFFKNLTRIEKTEIRCFPDFICEKDEIYGGADVEFNPLIVIIGALRMAFVFLKEIKNKPPKKRNTSKKQPADARNNIMQKESA